MPRLMARNGGFYLDSAAPVSMGLHWRRWAADGKNLDWVIQNAIGEMGFGV